MKKLFIAALLAVPMLMATSCGTGSKSGDAEMDKFIDDLMSEMTLDEKIGQLNLPVTGEIVTGQAKSSNVAAQIREGKVGGLFNLKGVDRIRDVQRIAVEESRLGIPLIFGMDVIHGYESVFPIPLGLSCSWDMEAIETSARVAAKEATASGICWTFSPMVDICHDARWGRIAEGSGEDAFLGSRIAEAMVRGYQGDNLADSATMMACVKHFALYGAPDGGRDYNTVDMSKLRMYNEYLPPYKAAFDAGAGTAMASFNTVDGVPATGNHWLLTELLRDDWGWNGFVVSDYTGIMEMTHHGMGDLQEVSALALKAGLDMDMVSDGFVGTIKKSIEEGKLTEKDVDVACRRILEAKYKLGLFEDPYRYCDEKRAASEVFSAENRAIAREVARKCFVLLKNDGNILPLKRNAKIALVGPLADTRANMPGTWSVVAKLDEVPSMREGFTKAVAEAGGEIIYAKGCNLMEDAEAEKNACAFGRDMRDGRSDAVMMAEALAAARRADVIVFAGGEASEMSGECSSMVNIEYTSTQRALLTELKKLGKPIVLLNFSGRPMVLNWETENIPAILECWFGGSEAADAICDVVFGEVAPSGKLTTSFPRHVGQLPYSYSHFNTGRPHVGDKFTKFESNYLDVPNSPLYPFGFGLSYTTFEYAPITLSATEMDAKGTITVETTVKNTGNYDADEVVQLYIRDLVGSVARPTLELKGFKRISLKAGESAKVEFTIDAELLKFYNGKLEFVAEPGEFQVAIAPNCRDLGEVKTFTLK